MISDLINNIFVRTFKGQEWDWTQTKWGWEIDKGLFLTDPNKSTDERVWEFASRIIWQWPQIILGDLIVSTMNALGMVNNVTHNYGVTAIDKGSGGAVTLGFYTAGPTGYTTDWRDHLFVHEYGHYIQSQRYGLDYLTAVGLPSFLSAGLSRLDSSRFRHNLRRYEAEASMEGANYFYEHYSFNPLASPIDLFDKDAFINGTTTAYTNPRTHNDSYSAFPESNSFHWSDILIYATSYLLTYTLFFPK